MGSRLLSVLLAVGVVACGQVANKQGDAGADASSGAALKTITVSAITLNLVTQRTSDLVAMGMYGDGIVKDVTTTVTWASSNTVVAPITGHTIAAASSGMATVTATLDGITGMATVTVPALNAIVASSYSSKGIDFFSPTANGDVVPIRSIRGAATTLVSPRGLAIIGQELFVVDQGANAICVFPLSGNGNIAPTRRVVGAATLLTVPSGITAFNNEIYVAAQSGTIVTVFPANANGNVAPSRTISGMNTTLTFGIGVMVFNNELYISNNTGTQQIVVFPVTANGNVTPTRTIVGPTTGIAQPQGMTVSGNDLYVAQGNNIVRVFPITASGDVAPVRTFSGPTTLLSFPDQITAVGNELYVANYGGGTATTSGISIYPLNATGDIAPTRFIGGAATQIAGALGLLVY